MAARKNRYREMERKMTLVILADLAFFLLYLLFASMGIVFLKVLLAILVLALSLLILGFLYLTRELLRQRSLWMTVSAFSIFLCTLVSLILNYPA